MKANAADLAVAADPGRPAEFVDDLSFVSGPGAATPFYVRSRKCASFFARCVKAIAADPGRPRHPLGREREAKEQAIINKIGGRSSRKQNFQSLCLGRSPEKEKAVGISDATRQPAALLGHHMIVDDRTIG